VREVGQEVGPLLRLRRRWGLCGGCAGGGASAEVVQEVGPLLRLRRRWGFC